MTRILATVRDGVIVPHEPLHLPEGTEVEIALTVGDEKPDSPKEIELWIAAWDAIPTPVMSDEEWAAYETRRRQDKEWELAHAEERLKNIRADLE